jgi:hypothetical protein
LVIGALLVLADLPFWSARVAGADDGGRDNEVVADRWRRWVPGPRHGLPRAVAVWGVPGPGPEQLAGLLGRCDQLRGWARIRGFELDDTPAGLGPA